MEYTTKQIASWLEVSKPTVQKAIKNLEIIPVRKENNNRAFYGYEDTLAIIKEIRPDFDVSSVGLPASVGEKTEEIGEKPQTETAKTENTTGKPQKQEPETEKRTEKIEELDLLRDMLSVIQEQIKEKDKQLAIKDKQIQDLNDRLAEAMALTKGQQYISAADKTKELLETKEQQEEAIIREQTSEEKGNPKEKGFRAFFKKILS